MEKLPLFAGFYTSQVVQDFFHQPYVSFGECIPFSLEKFCVMPVAAEILRHQCDKVSDQTSPLPCSPFVTFSDVATGDIYVVVTSGIALGVSVLKIWMCGCMMVKCTDDW